MSLRVIKNNKSVTFEIIDRREKGGVGGKKKHILGNYCWSCSKLIEQFYTFFTDYNFLFGKNYLDPKLVSYI